MSNHLQIIKYLTSIISIVILLGCTHSKPLKLSAKNDEKVIVKINYMMFAVDTYVPITKTTIRTLSSKNISLTKKEIKTIYKVFKKTIPIPKFDDQMIRLRIAIPNKEMIFLDATGVVLDGKEVKKIDILGLKTLENIFDIKLGSEIGLYSKPQGTGGTRVKYWQ